MNDIPSYTFSIKEIDLKKYVDFSRILHVPIEGSKVHSLHIAISQILQQLDTRDLLPYPILQLAELAWQGCHEWGVELNKRFIREVITAYIKSTDNYILVYRGKYRVDVARR